MNWLCIALDIMADEQTGFTAERERLESIQPIVITAEKFVRKKKSGVSATTPATEATTLEAEVAKEEPEIIQKKLKLVVVSNANRHTQKAARSLGHDFVVAIKRDGRFGMFMNRMTTRGFSPRTGVKMLRYLVMARKGEAAKAHCDWEKRLGNDGQYDGVEGIHFDGANKMILAFEGPVLQLSAADLRDVAERCLSVRQSRQWAKEMLRLYETRGQRERKVRR